MLGSKPPHVFPDPNGSSKFYMGGKTTNVRAKVKWDILTLSKPDNGLGIIDPKAQSEALFTKLLVRGLAPGGEP